MDWDSLTPFEQNIVNAANQNGANINIPGSSPNLNNYSSWNGDWKGYLEWLANHGDQAALDKLLNYLMSEQSSQNARDWTAQREDTAYQRLVADLKAAGINPYAFATFGASPFASSSGGHSYSGNYSASYEINKEKNQQNWLKVVLSSIFPVIGAAIAALL